MTGIQGSTCYIYRGKFIMSDDAVNGTCRTREDVRSSASDIQTRFRKCATPKTVCEIGSTFRLTYASRPSTDRATWCKVMYICTSQDCLSGWNKMSCKFVLKVI